MWDRGERSHDQAKPTHIVNREPTTARRPHANDSEWKQVQEEDNQPPIIDEYKLAHMPNTRNPLLMT